MVGQCLSRIRSTQRHNGHLPQPQQPTTIGYYSEYKVELWTRLPEVFPPHPPEAWPVLVSSFVFCTRTRLLCHVMYRLDVLYSALGVCYEREPVVFPANIHKQATLDVLRMGQLRPLPLFPTCGARLWCPFSEAFSNLVDQPRAMPKQLSRHTRQQLGAIASRIPAPEAMLVSSDHVHSLLVHLDGRVDTATCHDFATGGSYVDHAETSHEVAHTTDDELVDDELVDTFIDDALPDIQEGLQIAIKCDGSSLRVDAAHVAFHSRYFARVLGWRHSTQMVGYSAAGMLCVDFRGNEVVGDGIALGVALQFYGAGDTPIAAVVDDLKDGSLIVSLARIASYLQMRDLAAAVEPRLCAGLDVKNALSLLSLAREIDSTRLARLCRLRILESLPQVAASPAFSELPAAEQRTFRRLHQIKQRFGLPLSFANDGCDTRIFTAMLHETLRDQRVPEPDRPTSPGPYATLMISSPGPPHATLMPTGPGPYAILVWQERHAQAVERAEDDERKLQARGGRARESEGAGRAQQPRALLEAQRRSLAELEGLVAEMATDTLTGL